MLKTRFHAAAVAIGILAIVASLAIADESGRPDTLSFTPLPAESTLSLTDAGSGVALSRQDHWLRAPFGDDLLTDPDQWRANRKERMRATLRLDYNRVDRVRAGIAWEMQTEKPMRPRIGARLEYAFGRERSLYGVQLEQPLLPPGRLALGVSLVRMTDHSELQQVENLENSLALLFARQDYRDYFEREGVDAYLSWRVPDFSTVSVHVRNDEYRSLGVDRGTRSFFKRDKPLRPNPPIDEGTSRAVSLRLERLARRTHRTRAGFYHWIDLERSIKNPGKPLLSRNGLGGDFDYTRLLADLRSVFRLTPATTLSLRLVGGTTMQGTLPIQKQFTAGGVDGLRAHPFAIYRGDQLALGQAEYTVGLWHLRSNLFEGGLHAIAFTDLGRAWSDPEHHWNVGRQRIEADGGFGLSTSEDNLRVYFARNLKESHPGLVVSVRLQRPF